MLAPVNGREIALTLGTGHMAAFCRASNAGCKTPISYIKDAHGCINAHFLKMQKDFKSMLEEGWEFRYLPWQVEAAWPDAPALIQRALNATHECRSPPTELEGAVTIAEAIESGDDDKTAIDAAIAGSPVWAGYADKLLTLAKYYGGGKRDGADGTKKVLVPLLHKLDAFAKRHGENRRLGEEFLKQVVELKFPNFEQFPRVVDALMACNLVAPKVVDGIARCLTKTDVSGLAARLKLPELRKCEKHLESAERVAEHMLLKAGVPEEVILDAEGLFKVRIAAYLCKNGKQTFDEADYKTADEIVVLLLKSIYEMLDEVADPTKAPEVPDEWVAMLQKHKGTATEAARSNKAAEATTEASNVGLLTTNAVVDKAEVAARRGFTANKTLVYEKSVGFKSWIYMIESIGDECVLAEHDDFKEKVEVRVKVSVEALLAKWAPYKGEVAQRISGDWSAKLLFKQKEAFEQAAKAELIAAMVKASNDNPVSKDDLVLCIKPMLLRAGRDFERGDLTIVPQVGVSNITTSFKAGMYETGLKRKICSEEVCFYMTRPPQPSKAVVDSWEKSDAVSPFFWVTATGQQQDANMGFHTIKVDGVPVRVLQNKRGVKCMDVLRYFQEVCTLTKTWGLIKKTFSTSSGTPGNS